MNVIELLKNYGYKAQEITKIISFYKEKQCTEEWLYNKVIEIFNILTKLCYSNNEIKNISLKNIAIFTLSNEKK